MAIDYQTISALEKLRQNARRAYFYYACSLLAVLVCVILLDTWTALIACGIVALLYSFYFRPEMNRFRQSYQEAMLRCVIGRHLKVHAYYPKDALSLKQVKEDGCTPIENTKGIVRAGIRGEFREQDVVISDISYIYQLPGEGKNRTVSMTGCYVRIGLPRQSRPTAVFCSPELLPKQAAREYYATQGLRWESCSSEVMKHYDCYQCPETVNAYENVKRQLLSLAQKTAGIPVLRIDETSLTCFICHKVLGKQTENYNTPITQEMFAEDIFPELKELLEIAKGV